jgi:hypothetical protein
MSTASLQGSLETFKLPDVLTFLNSTKKTGMLTLATTERDAYVFLREGHVVYAASNQESLRLGPILLRKKKITRDQSEAIDDLMLRGGRPFSDVAREQGVLSEAQLDEFLKVQVSEVIYDCFVWKGGAFSFYDGIDLPAGAITISIDLANLIMEGARRIDEWEQCLLLLPDSSVVFRVVSDPDMEKITLSLEEWKILFLVNGQRTLEDICRDTEEDAFQVYRVVYGLFANKLIEPSPPPDDNATGPTPAVADETVRQSLTEIAADATVREAPDDTNLLVSGDAHLSYKDVVRKTVAQLSITSGDLAGTVIPLSDPECLIGRQRDSQIRLTDLGASARHARIYRGPDGYTLEDLKSRNGTWLNGSRITDAVLQDGDQIRIGVTDLRYQVLFEDQETPAAKTVIKARSG